MRSTSRRWKRARCWRSSIWPGRAKRSPALLPLCYDAPMIRITDTISLDESEMEESFVRSSGPGGQNVNKLSTAVQLRFDVRRSPSLPNDVAIRLMNLAGDRKSVV